MSLGTNLRSGDTSTVLIVEDEADLANLYQRYLTDEYGIHVAHTAEEALELFDDAVDVVLLDRRLPGMSGDELLAELRSRNFTGPVAMITGVEPDVDIVDLPFDEYVEKPIDRETLQETVKRLAHRAVFERKSRELFRLTAKKASLDAADPDHRDRDAYAQLTTRIRDLVRDLDGTMARVVEDGPTITSHDDLDQPEINELLEDILAHPLPEELDSLIVDSQELEQGRPVFMWQWVHRLAPQNTLPCVEPAHRDRVPVDKTITILFITLLDDCLEKRGDEATFNELARIPLPAQTARPDRTGADGQYVRFAQRVWTTLIDRLRAAPHFEEYVDLFRFDIEQAIDAIRYTQIPITSPQLATMGDLERCETHNMAMFAYADIDLMHSPIAVQRELGPLRDAVWDAQFMARIGNWISTWERELREGDFSAGPIVYALEEGIVSHEELQRAAEGDEDLEERLIERIHRRGVEKEFFKRWEDHYYRLYAHDRRLGTIELEPFIEGAEEVLRYHLASTGLK